MKTSNYLAKLPQEATIKNIQAFQDYDLITLDVPAPRQRLCPHCGSTDCVIKDSGVWQTVRHIPSNHRGTAVTFHKRRLYCKECRSTFYENPYWVHPSLHMTQALYDSILLDLTEPISFSEIARRNCVTQSTVQSVFETIQFGLPRKLPETICIDEFKGNTGIWSSRGHRWYLNKFHCSISDGDAHAVVDVLDQISGVAVNRYFHQFSPTQRQQVKYFCCDMSNGFVSVAKKNFPNARICIDPFHVIKRLNDMVDQVRLRYQNQFKNTGDMTNFRKIKGIARLLKTKEINQQKYWGTRYHENLQRLRDAFALAPDLLEAYDALQFFHEILMSFPYSVQQEDLTEWIHQYAASEVEEIHSAACTIRHWRGYIQNSWKYGKSNGLSEGLNNKVKVLKRVSFGLHNFDSFRKRILLTCGKLKLSQDPLAVLDDSKNGKEIRL